MDLDEVARREWYHTLELAPGVETPGFFDHRPLLRKLPIPASLAGQRCLDIGSFDGFWAFEMERRGAAEVIAADIHHPLAWDWPANADALAIEALERRKEAGGGLFLTIDAVDPMLTLMHPRRPISFLEGTARPWWWKPNLRGYEQMIRSAGLEVLRGPTMFLIPPGAEVKRNRVPWRALRAYEGRQAFIRRHAGDPHAFILARGA